MLAGSYEEGMDKQTFKWYWGVSKSSTELWIHFFHINRLNLSGHCLTIGSDDRLDLTHVEQNKSKNKFDKIKQKINKHLLSIRHLFDAISVAYEHANQKFFLYFSFIGHIYECGCATNEKKNKKIECFVMQVCIKVRFDL